MGQGPFRSFFRHHAPDAFTDDVLRSDHEHYSFLPGVYRDLRHDEGWTGVIDDGVDVLRVPFRI